MYSGGMMNLEQAIAEWRRQMLAAGINNPVPLEELESHLRQDIHALVSAGKEESEAFQLAVSRLGSPAAVRIEFSKIRSGPILSVKIGSLLWLGAVMAMAAVFARSWTSGRMNLLLVAHIFSVTAGYCAAFLIGIFGICDVCWRRSHSLSSARQQSLRRAVYLFSHVAVALVVFGCSVLGLPASKQYFGSYWRWDPKEIGGLCVCVWFMALALMQRFRQISDRVTMLVCIGGSLVVSLAWFGAGIMDYNQRMHGQASVTYWPLAAFLAIQIGFLSMGMSNPPNSSPPSARW
jgi:hypothetical protein